MIHYMEEMSVWSKLEDWIPSYRWSGVTNEHHLRSA
jgi:hypothetical protein